MSTFNLKELVHGYNEVVTQHMQEVKEFAKRLADTMSLHFSSPVYIVNPYGPVDPGFIPEVIDTVFNWPNPICLASPKVGVVVEYDPGSYIRFPVVISFDVDRGEYMVAFDAPFAEPYGADRLVEFSSAFFGRVEKIVKDDLGRRQSDQSQVFQMRGYF